MNETPLGKAHPKCWSAAIACRNSNCAAMAWSCAPNSTSCPVNADSSARHARQLLSGQVCSNVSHLFADTLPMISVSSSPAAMPANCVEFQQLLGHWAGISSPRGHAECARSRKSPFDLCRECPGKSASRQPGLPVCRHWLTIREFVPMRSMGLPVSCRRAMPGEPKHDQRNNEKLLQALAGIADRRAHFYRAGAGTSRRRSATDHCRGRMAWRNRGGTAKARGGFGYDPLFWVPQHQCSAAQLGRKRKSPQPSWPGRCRRTSPGWRSADKRRRAALLHLQSCGRYRQSISLSAVVAAHCVTATYLSGLGAADQVTSAARLLVLC